MSGTNTNFTNARRVAQLHRLLLSRLTNEAMAGIIDKLIEIAQEGNLQAIKLLLHYTIGKPVSAAELDSPYLAEPEAPKEGRREPVAAPKQPVPAVSSTPVPSKQVMRQIEEAVKIPRTLVNLPPTPAAVAAGGRH